MMVFDSNCRRTRLYHCWNIVSKNLWLISYEPWIKSHQISATVPWRHGNLGILIVVKCRSYASSLKQAMHVIFVQKPISLRWSTTNSFISGVFETIAASNFGKSFSICALSSYYATGSRWDFSHTNCQTKYWYPYYFYRKKRLT